MNVIYIHTHDTGIYTDAYGYRVGAENLLSFAKDATVFRQAYTVSPTCSPSRGALLTGLYPHSNGLVGLTHRGFTLVDKKQHLANFLKDKGYKTVISGIQHENGFWTNGAYAKELGYEIVLTEPVATTDGDEYALWDKQNTMNLCAWLDSNQGNEQPFFVSMGMFATHREYPSTDIDDRYIELPANLSDCEGNRHDTAMLHQSIKNFDENFKKIINTLKNSNYYENSIIIVTTDHGLANPFSKCNCNKEGTQVSLIIRTPERCTQGIVSDLLVSQIDVFPTICDALRLDKPKYLQGNSFIENLLHHVYDEREIYHEINFHTSYEPQRAIRTKRYVLIEYLDKEWKKYNISNCDDSFQKTNLVLHKWSEHRKAQYVLYDRLFDPSEKNNLSNEKMYKQILASLKEKLSKWRYNTNDNKLDIKQYLLNCKVNTKESMSPSIKNEKG